MAQPRVLILRSPGTNCEIESAYVFEQSGGISEAIHVNQLMEKPEILRSFQILCFPGGFSFGDDISAGQILASWLKHSVMDALQEFVASRKLMLGICNGFQVLMRTGLLTPNFADGAAATLTWNTNGRYTAKWVELEATNHNSPFLRGIDRMYLPIAHAEGRFVFRDDQTADRMEQAGQLALRYASNALHESPNGSQREVAGICDPTGHVLGLMPHPERNIQRTHHPHWTRLPADRRPDGLKLFENAIAYFK